MKQIFRKFRDRGFGLPGTRNFGERIRLAAVEEAHPFKGHSPSPKISRKFWVPGRPKRLARRGPEISGKFWGWGTPRRDAPHRAALTVAFYRVEIISSYTSKKKYSSNLGPKVSK